STTGGSVTPLVVVCCVLSSIVREELSALSAEEEKTVPDQGFCDADGWALGPSATVREPSAGSIGPRTAIGSQGAGPPPPVSTESGRYLRLECPTLVGGKPISVSARPKTVSLGTLWRRYMGWASNQAQKQRYSSRPGVPGSAGTVHISTHSRTGDWVAAISSTVPCTKAGAAAVLALSRSSSQAAHSRISAARIPGDSSAHTAGVMARRAARTSPWSASQGMIRIRARSAGSVTGGSSLVVMTSVCVGLNVIGFARIALPVSAAPPVSCLSRSAARWPRREPSSMKLSRRPLSP